MPAPSVHIDEAILEWATPAEARYIQAVNKHLSMRAAARELGVNFAGIYQCVQRAKKRAAMKGWSPEHDMSRVVPDPYIVRGVSTYYNKEGKAAGQWVKSSLDDDRRMEVMRETIAAMAADVPRLKPARPPKRVEADLCNLYTMTDMHVGMKSWGRETHGDDWDLDIAERTISGSFDYLIGAAPPAGLGIVAQIGDFLHYDSMSAITPNAGHQLDADSRYSKMVAVAVRTLRRVVDAALAKHARVLVVIQEGNHDPIGSVWLRTVFAACYENEPRVKVLAEELPYAAVVHGATMIGWHHGHLKKVDELPLLFAAQYPKEWGATRHRYVHTGHYHHTHEREHNGITIIQHPTLAARDAYAARGGWVAERSITGVTYHSKHGQVGRVTVTPEMIEASAKGTT